MIGIVFIAALVLGLMSGLPFVAALLNAILWTAIITVVLWLLSFVFGAGLLAVFGLASLFKRKG